MRKLRETHDWWSRNRPESIWVLIDKSNSNQRSRNYLWWFETRELAREFLKFHKKNPYASTLRGPYQFLEKKGFKK